MTSILELGWSVPILGVALSLIAVIWGSLSSRAFDRRLERERNRQL